MEFNFIYLIIVVIVTFISMALHEFAHGYVSYLLGDDTAKNEGRLTINPIKHVDLFLTIILPIMLALTGAPVFGGAKPIPFNPNNIRGGEWGVALVAVAGPIMNLLISFVVFGLWSLIGAPSGDILGQIFINIIYINLGFFIFNMIPIPPLDGSRVLYILAPDFIKKGMEYMERFGFIVILIILLLANSFIIKFMSSVIYFFFDLFSRIFGLV